MSSNSFAANALENLLSWFESLFNGIWSLFTGSGDTILRWLSANWLMLLILFMLVGIVLDVVVYLLRWRPFWWWFRKKRYVVDDRLLQNDRGARSSRKSSARRVTPSTRIPVRDERVSENTSDEDNLFMDSSIFDVKHASNRSSTSLYADEPRKIGRSKRTKPS